MKTKGGTPVPPATPRLEKRMKFILFMSVTIRDDNGDNHENLYRVSVSTVAMEPDKSGYPLNMHKDFTFFVYASSDTGARRQAIQMIETSSDHSIRWPQYFPKD